MVHIRALARHLAQRGWEIVERPDGQALVHCHAMERAPLVDVHTNHGIYPLKEQMPHWQIDANRNIFDNLKLARRVIAVSQWTADQWTDLPGVQPAIIPNGIDLAEWQAVLRGAWRARLRIPESTPLVLWGKTGLSDVLDPTPALMLAARRPDIRVVMPIDATRLPVAPKNVRCIGPLPFPEMQRLLADCDVYLATVCENHSIQVLEAMALARPIIGFAWGGTAETITNGQDGILVPPHDVEALEAALAEALERQVELGAAAQETVAARYQWCHLVEQIEMVYEAALAERAQDQAPRRPKCSIIIPCYNKAAYVQEAIRSALDQVAAPPYEIIVIDDGSTDDSLSQIRQTLGAHPQVRLIAQENQGVAAARNAGIRQAQGRYICCLDADDRTDPYLLNRLSAALDADPGLGIAYSDMVVFGPSRVPGVVHSSEYDFDRLKQRNFIPCCNLFRRTAWERAGGYKDINPSWEDYELWLNMGRLGWPGRRVPGGLFWYRKLPAEGRDYASKGLEWRLRAIINSYHRDLYPPLVSFVVPCYRQSQFLAEALDAALAQTLPDLEVVVVDDGNAPEEVEAIREIVGRYSPEQVRLVHHERNQGLAAARNTGVTAARGQWIVPLDADDKVAPEFLEACMAAVKMDPQTFAYTDSYLWWPIAERTQLLAAEEYNFDRLLRHISWPCTVLYHRDAWQQVGGYREQMSEVGGWEDWEFAISLGEIGICGVRVPQPLFYYRQHSPEQMRNAATRNKAVLRETLRWLHAAVYRGERPMGCCGNRQVVPAAAGSGSRSVSAGEDEVLIRYVGPSFGTQNWVGPSGRSYRFGQAEPLQTVRRVDADWFAQRPDFTVVMG